MLPKMGYFEAWFIGLTISQITTNMGMADNQGIDCFEMRKAIEETLAKP